MAMSVTGELGANSDAFNAIVWDCGIVNMECAGVFFKIPLFIVY